MTVHYERIPSTDPRLARHIRHDSQSRRYGFPTAGLSIVNAKHTRGIPVLDQGQLGSCTGNAGIGCLGTEPFYETYTPVSRYPLTEAGAVQLYSDATSADDYPGQYPPDDTGSDGLTIAKMLKAAGEISGYQHTFSLGGALKALGQTPVIVGVAWHQDMFDPDPDGRLRITGPVVGGHEFVVDEVDADAGRVWLTNSWGAGWGIQGRAYLTFADFGALLADQGDVTIFTPLTQPAPQPTPAPVPPAPADPDAALAAVARPWVAEHHVGDNHRMATALRGWLATKGL
ncbi:MAG TPA: hypothetical protein VL652_34745 [Kutzneria sp.]|nr:hypothetical protein [Kutzneria sp.]